MSPSAPDYSASDYFMGWGSRRAGSTIAPALVAHVAEELRNDYAIVKEQRKAKEEKVLRGKNKGTSKGKPSEAAANP